MKTTKITITQSTDVWKREKISVVGATLYIAKQVGPNKESKCFQCSFNKKPKLCNTHTCGYTNNVIWVKVK